jgi:hypothetical protein
METAVLADERGISTTHGPESGTSGSNNEYLSASRVTSPGPHTQDLRVAGAMTGGVSLAVWIGGVARELNLLQQAAWLRDSASHGGHSVEAAGASAMITRSDNDAASALWAELGHAYIRHFLNLAGMKQTVSLFHPPISRV